MVFCVFSLLFRIYIRKPHVFFHYWRRREPPVGISIADFRSAFIVYGHFLFFILVLPKICNGKTKGLAIRSQKHYTFDNCSVLHKETQNTTLLNLHKETTGFVFHYWRRREPPVVLRHGDSRCSFAKK